MAVYEDDGPIEDHGEPLVSGPPQPLVSFSEATTTRGSSGNHHFQPSSEAATSSNAPIGESDQMWEMSGEIARRFLAAYSGGTRRSYDVDLRDLFAYMLALQVPPLLASRALLEGYVQHLRGARGLAPTTIARRLATCAGYFRFGVEDEAILRDPMSFVRRPRVSPDSTVRGLSLEELRRLIAVADGDCPRSSMVIRILACNGLRVSELTSARVEDLREERGHRVLPVRRKGGKKQLIVLAPTTTAAIDRCLDGRTDGPLVLSRSNGALTARSVAKLLKRLANEALPHRVDIHPHTLRHAYCDAAIAAGVSLRRLQLAAGHTSALTTSRYLERALQLDQDPAYEIADFLAAPSHEAA